MAKRKKGLPLDGWLVLDKPDGMTSTQAMAKCRWLLQAQKAGHGGTLDPIATGILPIAFGEATKTVPYAMDGEKTYRFTLCFGEARDTDDCAGAVTATHPFRPDDAAIEAVLERFTGLIDQVPPRYSAIRIDGERAYDLAREGTIVEMQSRQVRVDGLYLIGRPDADHAEFEVECGKGTYMRSLARDIALACGSVGHVSALRRLRVGRFTLAEAVTLPELEQMAADGSAVDALYPVEMALDALPTLSLSSEEALCLRQGQTVLLIRRQDAERLQRITAGLEEGEEATALALCNGLPVALVKAEGARIRPVRVLNLAD
jgi:tRNA pseudouridine55 synthase